MSDSDPSAPLLGWVRPAHWRVLDRLVGVGYGAIAFAALADGVSGPGWLAALAGAACLAGPIAVRRRAPVVSLAVLLAYLAVTATFASSAVVMALPPMVLVLYSVAAQTSVITGAVALLATGGAVLATRLPDVLHPGGVIVAEPVFAAAWALGAVFGLHRRHLRVQLELRDEVRQANLRRAELELVQQRVRIARELHDVVAHGLSVITVQAGFAGLVADDANEVRSALGSIETTGRQTLSEMRTLLDVLRDGTDLGAPALAPAPRLDDVEALVSRVREAGVDVVLTRRGPMAAVPALTELNAYRIVQEALTNVVKHAGPVRTTVDLVSAEGELSIVVRDAGPAVANAAVEPGHGIVGMRERARILGGTLTAGPLSGGGYEVIARIPLLDVAPMPRTFAADPA